MLLPVIWTTPSNAEQITQLKTQSTFTRQTGWVASGKVGLPAQVRLMIFACLHGNTRTSIFHESNRRGFKGIYQVLNTCTEWGRILLITLHGNAKRHSTWTHQSWGRCVCRCSVQRSEPRGAKSLHRHRLVLGGRTKAWSFWMGRFTGVQLWSGCRHIALRLRIWTCQSHCTSIVHPLKYKASERGPQLKKENLHQHEVREHAANMPMYR